MQPGEIIIRNPNMPIRPGYCKETALFTANKLDGTMRRYINHFGVMHTFIPQENIREWKVPLWLN